MDGIILVLVRFMYDCVRLRAMQQGGTTTVLLLMIEILHDLLCNNLRNNGK